MPRPSTEMRHNTQPKGHFGRQNVHTPMLCSLHAIISLCSTVVCYNDRQQESWRTEQKKLKKDAAFFGMKPPQQSILSSIINSIPLPLPLPLLISGYIVCHKITNLCLYFLGKKMHGFVSYGHWDFCDGIPVAHYIEPVVNSKRAHFFQEQQEKDLFKVQAPLEPVACYYHRDPQMKKRRGEKQQREKQGRRVLHYGTPKAVDEDLYKIPPELLYQIPKRKSILGNFLSGCLGLCCMA